MSVLKYNEYITESLVSVKRKYTEAHPEKKVSEHAPVRERIFAFVAEHGEVSYAALQEFVSLLNEETGRKTNMNWVKANSVYFTIKEKDGNKTISLSRKGKTIHEKLQKNYKTNQPIINEDNLNEELGWSAAKQIAMDKSIHSTIKNPSKMPIPTDPLFLTACSVAVDSFWPDWDETQDTLVLMAMGRYYRKYFPKEFRLFQKIATAEELIK